MRRGEVWTVAGGKEYAGKARPVVILQDDYCDATASITICAATTDRTEAPLFRLPIEPNASNGLRAPCRLMVDKITTVPKSKIGSLIGRLDDEDVLRLNRAVLVFLGPRGPGRPDSRPRRPARGRGRPRSRKRWRITPRLTHRSGPLVSRRFSFRGSA